MSDFTYFLIAVFFNQWKLFGIILLVLIFTGSVEAGPYKAVIIADNSEQVEK